MKFRIRVFSDLHLEFRSFTLPEHRSGEPVNGNARQDLVVLAGDIGPGVGCVHWARHWFPDVPVFLIPGNHEHYGCEISQNILDLKEAAYGSLVKVFEREEMYLHGIRFLCCTLWTDFSIFGEENRIRAMQNAGRELNDYRLIKYGKTNLSPVHTAQFFEESVAWLADRLNAPHDGPTVVITHHAPHRKSIPPERAEDIRSAAYASDLERLMGKAAALWIHGHVHCRCDYNVRGTRVVCNPRGYHSFDPTGFDPNFVVSIDADTGELT